MSDNVVTKLLLIYIQTEHRPHLFKVLFENGADINARDVCNMTVLHWAVKRHNARLVGYLLSHKDILPSTINAKNRFGMTALHYACREGCFGIVKLLMRNKDHLITKDTTTNDQSITPLSLAIDHNMHDIVEYLNNL